MRLGVELWIVLDFAADDPSVTFTLICWWVLGLAVGESLACWTVWCHLESLVVADHYSSRESSDDVGAREYSWRLTVEG